MLSLAMGFNSSLSKVMNVHCVFRTVSRTFYEQVGSKLAVMLAPPF